MRPLLAALVVVLLVAAAAQGAPQSLPLHSDPAVFHHLVYIGIQDVDRALGCPADQYGCFYTFVADAGAGVTSRRRGGTHACHIVRSNCNAHGECIKRRSWCIVRRGLPAWLLKRFPRRWVTEQRPAYLLGRTDLLNPTHIASLHFLPLMRWMDAEHMQLGQVLMVWDNNRSAGPGPYGLGMAAAFGETQWLPHMSGPMMFRHIRMGEFGDLRFPYPLDRAAPHLQPDPAFQRLAAVVKRSHGAPATAVLQPRVVIARRQRTRILANAGELQVRLAAAGLNAAIVDFGAMSFESQVQVAHGAAVLVSVHGADCMNLMFLPPRGCLVEVLPVHYGYGPRTVMRKTDYFNLARLLGKQYMEVISTGASSIIRDSSGQLADWNHVNFVGNVTVDLDAIVPVIISAVATVCDGKCAHENGT